MKKNLNTVSVFGLGKLGLPFAAAMGSQGFNVIGVDPNPKLKKTLQKKRAPFFEPELQDFLDIFGNRITLADPRTAVMSSSITFIVVATPSEKKGSFSLKYVLKAIKEIGTSLKDKKAFHLVVLTSTVSPLSITTKIIPNLEKYSKKKCGLDFGFCYNPEFIALGSVIKNLFYPDFVLIGESDKKSGDVLQDFYRSFCKNKPEIFRMNVINAEITKISLNTYVTMKISFANYLANICENVPGGNVDIVTSALGEDSRIGHKYLRGGLGYGGPCFPRDNRALSVFSRKIGVKSYLATATDVINKTQVDRIVRKIKDLGLPGSKIAILGSSYKPNTAVVEESQAVIIAKVLSRQYRIWIHDPIALENTKKVLGQKVRYAKEFKACIHGAKIIVLATPWQEFVEFLEDINTIKLLSGNPIIIDCWRVLDKSKLGKSVKYLAMGIGENYDNH